jgi:3'-5' exoribonuclease
MPHQFIKEFKVGDKIQDYFLVKSKRTRISRNSKTYLDLDLGDRSGQINAKVWDRAEQLAEFFERGDVIKIKGTIDEYEGQKQMKVADLRPTSSSDDYNRADLVKVSPYDPAKLIAFINDRIAEIKEPGLRRLLERFLADEQFVAAFKSAPAARNVHHAYEGGLLEHTSKVLRIALFTADELYPGEVDRDVLIAGAILHDIGKTQELDPAIQGGYTKAGYLIGHVTIGADMVRDRARTIKELPPEVLLELLHLLLSHHGERDFGAPVVPMTPEAMIIHSADNLDAKTQIVLTTIADDPNPAEEFTQYHKTLGRHFYKSPRRAAKLEPRVIKDEQ